MTRRTSDAPPESGPRRTRAAVGARRKRSAAMTVRLDAAVLARVDALVEARSTAWRQVTRSEILRELIGLGLADSERRAPRPRHLRLVRPEERASSKPAPTPGKKRRE